jgi:hypothetical protein
MQQKWVRSLFAISATFALSIPAQAAPNRNAMTFWGEVARWVESFWEGRTEWGAKLGPLGDPDGLRPTSSSPDKLGPLIDPDGRPAPPPAADPPQPNT